MTSLTGFWGVRVLEPRVELSRESRPNETWAMDFVSDQLFDGRRFRSLTLIDSYTRECLAIHVYNGPEFISKDLDFWDTGRELRFSFPGPASRQIMQ